MSGGAFLFTSESVGQGHPDKLADQISDAVLDAMLAEDPNSRVACETMVTTGLCIVAGEITSKGMEKVNIAKIARRTIVEIGYNDDRYGIDGNTCGMMVTVDEQSPDINQGVDQTTGEIGAGDQGMMFGFACRETKELMPAPIAISHRIVNRQTEVRKSGELAWLGPDAKGQVTVEYEAPGKPVRITTVVLSTQHDAEHLDVVNGKKVLKKSAQEAIIETVIKPVLPSHLIKGDIRYFINPTGAFVIGGPQGDVGLTGRKIIVDTYGGMGRHGGGAFSGKDSSKVDRSAAYMARYVAKNIVAAELADRCEVQLAYAIGVVEPVSIHVDTFGTGKVSDRKLEGVIAEVFRLTPRGIIESLELRRPIFRLTASGGHFGRELPEFTWEKTDKVSALQSAVGRASLL